MAICAFMAGSHAVRAGYISDGYTDKRSYDAGETVQIYINGIGNYINCGINVLDIENNAVACIITSVFPQSPAGINPWEDGFGYSLTASFQVPPNMNSGIYSLENKIFFIVKNPQKNAAITILYPSNTEEAYNPAGTKSLYDFNSANGRSHTVSFQRPFDSWMIANTRGFSTAILQWMHSLGNYDFQVIADSDLDDYNEISHSRMLIVVGHSEYWTREARENFDRFVDNGGDAIVLSGNSMWWQVRYSPDGTKLICYKDSALDPEQNPLRKTINWPSPTLQYPVLNSIGADWPHGAYANKAAYHGVYGFKVLNPASPLFNGTGLSYHDTLACISNEDDATLFSGFEANGDPILDSVSLGFCQIEMIAYDWGQSLSYPNAPQTGYGTFVIFRKTPFSGTVINVANSNWCAGTTGSPAGGFSGKDSTRIKIITKNMMDLLLSGTTVFSKPGNCIQTSVAVNGLMENTFSVFPNPANGEIFVQSPDVFENTLFELYDLSGRTVARQPIQNPRQRVELFGLPGGSYFYRIISGDKTALRGKILLTE